MPMLTSMCLVILSVKNTNATFKTLSSIWYLRLSILSIIYLKHQTSIMKDLLNEHLQLRIWLHFQNIEFLQSRN